jgi:hypothetical protein
VRLPTRSIVLAAAALSVFAAACTGGGTTSTGTTTTEPTAPPTVDQGDVAFAPGEFVYQLHGVKAELTWNGGSGELTITNNSGGQLGAPALYAVTHEGQRVDATVQGAAPMSDGDGATLKVTFPSTLKPADMGIIALVFGDQNWGAFAPVPAASPSATPSA